MNQLSLLVVLHSLHKRLGYQNPQLLEGHCIAYTIQNTSNHLPQSMVVQLDSCISLPHCHQSPKKFLIQAGFLIPNAIEGKGSHNYHMRTRHPIAGFTRIQRSSVYIGSNLLLIMFLTILSPVMQEEANIQKSLNWLSFLKMSELASMIMGRM